MGNAFGFGVRMGGFVGRSPAHLLASAPRLAFEVFVSTRVGRLLVLVLPQVHCHSARGCDTRASRLGPSNLGHNLKPRTGQSLKFGANSQLKSPVHAQQHSADDHVDDVCQVRPSLPHPDRGRYSHRYRRGPRYPAVVRGISRTNSKSSSQPQMHPTRSPLTHTDRPHVPHPRAGCRPKAWRRCTTIRRPPARRRTRCPAATARPSPARRSRTMRGCASRSPGSR